VSKRAYRVHFTVPSLNIIAKASSEKPNISPGILNDLLNHFAENTKSKQVNVALDGKKINASLTSCHG